MNPKQLFPFFLILILSTQLSAQIKFEPGYFIDNNGTKTECLIKNVDWVNTPEKIEYKLSDNGEPTTEKMTDIREFWVSETKYVRFTVDIDQSGNDLLTMSHNIEPEFAPETLFLKCHIEGCASLYESPKHKKFFLKVNDSAIFQLVRKEYILDNKVTPNNAYKSQLYTSLKCPSITRDQCKNTTYTKSDLKNIVSKYNECKSCPSVTYSGRKNTNALNLKIRPGIRMSWLSVENSQPPRDKVAYDHEVSLSLGLEAEFVLPFNKNKWGLTFGSTYQSYKTTDPRPYFTNVVDYSSLELSIGICYYMFLNKKSRLYASVSGVLFDLPFNDEIGSIQIKPTKNLVLGIGYSYNQWLSGEISYSTPRDLLNSYVYYSSSYQTISFTLGISIFRKQFGKH